MIDITAINMADIIVCLIIISFACASAKIGVVKCILGLFSDISAIIISKLGYPFITRILIATPIYDSIKAAVIKNLNLESIISSQSKKFEAEMINSLSLPEAFKTGLIQNNNSEVYNILHVSTIEEYIGGYIAMILINVIVVIMIYLLCRVLIRFLVIELNLIARLPIIRTANKLGGAILGVIWAIVVIWIGMCIITLFMTGDSFSFISESIATSQIAVRLYENNIILHMINKIIV